jgi:protein-S-isoprenylcysteine O-methyltransferase Ste14
MVINGKEKYIMKNQGIQKLDKYGKLALIREYLARIIMVFILVLTSGTWTWINIWIYAALATLTSMLVYIFVVRVNPSLYNERGKPNENTKRWDLILMRVIILISFSSIIIAGLDKKNDWSSLGDGWIIPGGILIILSGMLATWAMSLNNYFSSVVRIQYDHGHTVVTCGPYQYIRHPGYLSGIFFYLGTPMVLDSVYGFIPFVCITIGFGIRVIFEEKMLVAELDGYQGYTHKVKYRLIPGIW